MSIRGFGEHAVVVAVVVLFGVLWLCASGQARAADLTKEQQIKAAFLYNFTKFVDWPRGCFSNASDPIVIGVLGRTAIGSALEDAVKDRKVNGRGIIVRNVAAAEEVGTVHVLFVAATEEARFAAVQPAIESSPILTIGESSSFANVGGTINFVMEGDKVRFEINMDSAERAGLGISAQLQKLAKLILKRS